MNRRYFKGRRKLRSTYQHQNESANSILRLQNGLRYSSGTVEFRPEISWHPWFRMKHLGKNLSSPKGILGHFIINRPHHLSGFQAVLDLVYSTVASIQRTLSTVIQACTQKLYSDRLQEARGVTRKESYGIFFVFTH